jgi:pilus assembly protein CpaB
MNRKRLILVGVLAVVLAGAVSFAVYRLLRGMVGVNAAASVSSVVVAAKDLTVGAKIEARDVRLAQLPASELPSNVFHNTSDVVGRGVLVPIQRSELILGSKVAGEEAGAGLPALIPTGMRAVSVKVNDVVSVSGFVLPGTRVDVLLTGQPSKSNDTPTTTTVLENVQVLSAGPKLEKDANGQPVNVPVITLLVSPEDAQKLTLAATQGQIQLSLRSPMDLTQPEIVAVQNPSLYRLPEPKPREKAAPKKVKEAVIPPPSAMYVVEMIRGDKRDVSKF